MSSNVLRFPHRETAMPADDGRHGTAAGAREHYRYHESPCPPCRDALHAYQKRQRYDLERGARRMIPTPKITAHLKSLIAGGMTAQSIADESGVSKDTIQNAISSPLPTMRAANANAILAVTGRLSTAGKVDPKGTIRRIHALGRLGWAMNDIVADVNAAEPETPLIVDTLRMMSCGGRKKIRVTTAQAVARAYERLSMRVPENTRHHAQVRALAAAKNWAPPLAWDDIDNDPEPNWGGNDIDVDPVVVMRLLEGDRIPSTKAEKDAAMEQWVADGGSKAELCSWHGWKTGRYGRPALQVIEGGAA